MNTLLHTQINKRYLIFPFFSVKALMKLFLFFTLLSSVFEINHVFAQCGNGTNQGDLAAPAANAVSAATSTRRDRHRAWTGITANTTYLAVHASANTWITVRSTNATTGPVIAFGETPLIWTSAAAGTYYISYNTSSACATATAAANVTLTNLGPSGSSLSLAAQNNANNRIDITGNTSANVGFSRATTENGAYTPVKGFYQSAPVTIATNGSVTYNMPTAIPANTNYMIEFQVSQSANTATEGWEVASGLFNFDRVNQTLRWINYTPATTAGGNITVANAANVFEHVRIIRIGNICYVYVNGVYRFSNNFASAPSIPNYTFMGANSGTTTFKEIKIIPLYSSTVQDTDANDATAPSVPAGLAVANTALSTSLDLSWTAPADNGNSYFYYGDGLAVGTTASVQATKLNTGEDIPFYTNGNADFQNAVQVPWQTWTSAGTVTYAYNTTNNLKFNDGNGASMTSTTANTGVVYHDQTGSIVNGQKYLVSCWVKSTNAASGASFSGYTHDNATTPVTLGSGATIKPTTEWQLYSYVLTGNANNKFRVHFVYTNDASPATSGGTIYFDKVQIRPIYSTTVTSGIKDYYVDQTTGSPVGTGSDAYTGSTAVTKTITGLTANTQYCFAVKARDNGNYESAASSTVCKYTRATVVTSFTAVSNACTSIDLAWSGGVWSTVRVRCVTTGTDVYTGSGTSFSHSSLTPGSTYNYEVYVRNGDGLEEVTAVAANTTVISCGVPAITSISPTSGCSGSAQVITINGTNIGGSAITVNGVSATVLTSSSTVITVSLPAGASGTGYIVATNVSGSSSSADISQTFTVNPIPTLDGITVSSPCWITNGSNDYQITVKATGNSPTAFDGSNYGLLALINFQGAHAGSHGGYYAWNSTLAGLSAQGYTQNQVACTGGGFVGMYAAGYGATTATLIGGTTSVSGNQRTVIFTIRPNATFPNFTDNSVSQYASTLPGNCGVGWTETPNLFTSSPAIPTNGTVTVNGDSNPANLIEVCIGETITVGQSGFNNQGGVTYAFADNTTAFGGWTELPYWEIMNYGGITPANQVAGQTNVNGLATYNFKINATGIYVLHHNAAYGQCYAPGVNRYININDKPATPTTPTSNSPQCAAVGVTITRVAPPSGVTWYWQSSASGTSTANSAVTNVVTVSGTYYLRAQNNTTLCWSDASASITIAISPTAPVVGSPSPSNGNTTVCFGGTGAVSSISWGASAGATGYNVYFGTSTTPPLVSTNQAGLSYNIGTLAGATTYYWKIVPINGCGLTDPGTNWSFTTQPTACGYCTPAPSSVDGTGITNVTMGSINNTTGSEAGNFAFYNLSTSATQGATVNFSITYSTAGYGYFNKIWVDWNNDGDFDDSGEEVFNNGNSESPANTPSVQTGSFVIPVTATVGNHRIRIGGNDSGTPIPCYTAAFGTYEDYVLNVQPMPLCSGSPVVTTAGPATQNIPNGSTGVVSISGLPIQSGFTYQWQTSSSASGPFSNVVGGSGATSLSYTTTSIVDPAYYFLCVVTCSNSGLSSNSTIAEVLRDYCLPSSTTTTSRINSFSTTLCPTNITNTTNASSAGGYGNFTAQSVSQYQSLAVNFSVATTASMGIAIWVDWNNDDDFNDAGEQVAGPQANATSFVSSFTIPAGQAPGNYRMRVMGDFNSDTPIPCTLSTGTRRGEVEDYTLTVLFYPTCSGTPSPGSILTAANPICIGSTATLNIQSPVVASGLTYQWQYSDDEVTWTNISLQSTSFDYIRGFKIDVVQNVYIRKYRCLVSCSGNSVYTPILALVAQNCFPTSGSVTVPATFSCVKMNAWAGGGGGGGSRGNTILYDVKAGGGGGGGFAGGNQPVNVGSAIALTIGAGGAGGAGSPTDGSDGGASSISIDGTVIYSANGGIGGRSRFNTTNGTKLGTGGTGTTSNGGNGGPVDGANSSGGGGGGGTTGNGGNGSATVAGTGGVSGGGNGGGARTDSGNGFPGDLRGGGGGGARSSGGFTINIQQTGGAGGAGYGTVEFPLTTDKGSITNTNSAASPISLCAGGTVSSSGGGSPAVNLGSVSYLWRIGERLGAGDYNFGNWQTIGTGASISSIDPATYFPASTEFLIVRSVVSSCGALGWPTTGSQDNYIWVNVTIANAEITSSSAFSCPGAAFTVSGTITATGSWTLELSDGSTVTGSGDGTWSTTLYPSASTVYTLSSMSGATCASSAILTGTSTATVSNAVPSSVATATGATLIPGDLLWSGNSSTAWGSNTNWYTYNGTSFVVPGAGIAPTSNDRVFVLPSSTSGICISSTNNTTVTASGTAKNVYIGAGATMLIDAGQSLQVNGNWINNGTFTPNATATVEFAGGAAQTIDGSSANDFTNLTLNKSANTLTLNKPVTVSETLTMTAGNIATDETNLLTVGTSAAAPGLVYGSGGSVVGPLKRWFAAGTNSTPESGIFPVGLPDTNRYAQINYTSTLSTGGSITAEYISGPCPVLYAGLPQVINGQMIQNYENEGYWSIAPNGGDLNTATYSLILRGNTLSTVTSAPDMAALRLMKSVSHTTWDNTGIGSHSAPAGGVSDFTISNSGMTGFSFFNIGSGNANPLPVTMLDFAANCNEKSDVDVKWTTASEQNSQSFIVERSRDLTQWEYITTINAAGNSNYNINYATVDENPFGGLSYYRLVQTDINGSESIYGPISVSCSDQSNNMIVFPNPTKASFIVEIYSSEALNQASLNVTDLSGKVVSIKSINIQKGKNQFFFSDLGLQLGTYFINVSSTMSQILPIKLIVN